LRDKTEEKIGTTAGAERHRNNVEIAEGKQTESKYTEDTEIYEGEEGEAKSMDC